MVGLVLVGLAGSGNRFLNDNGSWGSFDCQFLFLFWDFWRLEVTFSEMLVSLGRLWTRLVPGGVQGADVGEMLRSSGFLLALFWGYFWSKMVMCLRCFV